MSDTLLIKENAELLAAAQRIFGDIVVKAYISTWTSILEKNGESLKRLTEIEKNKIKSEVCYSESIEIWSDAIGVNQLTIILEFSNGHHVSFHSSEFGGIGKLEKDFLIVDQSADSDS